MPDSIQSLEEELTAKRHELDAVSNALSGATVGAVLTRGSLIGTVVGGAITHDQKEKERLEQEIADIEAKISDTHDRIFRLKTKISDLMSEFQNEKAYFDADMRQKRNDLERQKIEAQTPDSIREVSNQIMLLEDDIKQQEVSREQKQQQEINTIQHEINQLTF